MSKGVTLPHVEPIIAVYAKKNPFDDPAWIYDFKYDGFRGVLYIQDGVGYIKYRRGVVADRFKSLANTVAKALNVKSAILDGEVIASDETKRPIFENVVKNSGKLSYVAFDILWWNGKDLRTKSLRERRKILQRILSKKSDIISLPLTSKHGKEMFELVCKYDLEGIVAKRESDPYEHLVKWIKIKNKNYSQQHDIRKNFSRKKK